MHAADAPVSTRVTANGLSHHVLTWNADGQPTVVLCHGFLDMAWSFHWLAELLAQRGLRVVAFDFRGHGKSQWVGAGGYYHFPDYVLDMAELLPQVCEAPVHLVGHSMGGTACALFAATRPNAIRSLTLVEGLGPRTHAPADGVDRLRAFADSVERVRSRPPAAMASLDEAARRLSTQHPELGAERARFIAERATVAGSDGWRWRFDPLHRTTAPTPFLSDVFLPILGAITAPTLVVMGERGFRVADEETRRGAIAGHRFVELAGASHMIHWHAAEALAAELGRFVDEHR